MITVFISFLLLGKVNFFFFTLLKSRVPINYEYLSLDSHKCSDLHRCQQQKLSRTSISAFCFRLLIIFQKPSQGNIFLEQRHAGGDRPGEAEGRRRREPCRAGHSPTAPGLAQAPPLSWSRATFLPVGRGTRGASAVSDMVSRAGGRNRLSLLSELAR